MIIHFYSKNKLWCKKMNDKFKDFIDNNEFTKKYNIRIIIERKNLLELNNKQDSIFVSPSNSLARMEGGIDRIMSREIFPTIDYRFIKLINKLGIINNNPGLFKNYCILPVGSSLFIEVPYECTSSFPIIDKINCGVMISPTMFISSNVNHTKNAYASLLSSLLLFNRINQYKRNTREKEFERIYITGHCCGNGGMDLDKSIEQFYRAFCDFIEKKEVAEMDYINNSDTPDYTFILLEYKEEEKKYEIDTNNIKTIKITDELRECHLVCD